MRHGGHRVSSRRQLESHSKAWRHEGAAVWELPMFKRGWDIKSNKRSRRG